MSEVTQLCSLQPDGLYPSRFLHPWDFPGKNTGVGCYFLLQGIFPTQGSNLGLPHCRQTHYCLRHQGSPAAAAKSLQSCPTLSDPVDCSPPGSSVHGVFQARVQLRGPRRPSASAGPRRLPACRPPARVRTVQADAGRPESRGSLARGP